MEDLKDFTLERFRESGPPKPTDLPEAQRPTGFGLYVLRKQYGPDLALGFMKWGMPIVRDVVAVGCFEAAKKAGTGDAGARAFASMKSRQIDWAILERIMREDTDGYAALCESDGEGESLKSAMAGLEYGMANRLPGVRVPGDVYALMCNQPGTV